MLDYDALKVGENLTSLEVEISHNQIIRYAGASGDFNPIHHNVEFAKSVGLESTIAHGMFVMAQISKLCSSWVEQSKVSSFGVKFKNMTKMGEVIVCTGKIKRKEDHSRKVVIAVEAKNVEGEVKASGDIVVTL